MNKEDARYFACLMEDFLDIPSFVCETIESKMMNGEYEEVCHYVIQRKRELEIEKGKENVSL